MPSETKLYIGNLPPDIRNKDIEDLFYKYGTIVNIDLKNHKGPPFAFIEFEDSRDASDAMYARDNYNYDGYSLRVEFPRGNGPYPSRFDDRHDNRMGGAGRGRGGSNRTNHRVLISGLPDTGSWQDLKDHMREAGDVCYTDVYRDGTGIVEFLRNEDMKYAARKLDDSKFRSHEGEVSYIRVKIDYRNSRSRSRSRSYSPDRRPSRGRRASPSYSPIRSRSRSPY